MPSRSKSRSRPQKPERAGLDRHDLGVLVFVPAYDVGRRRPPRLVGKRRLELFLRHISELTPALGLVLADVQIAEVPTSRTV
jgi:hypothetical protein